MPSTTANVLLQTFRTMPARACSLVSRAPKVRSARCSLRSNAESNCIRLVSTCVGPRSVPHPITKGWRVRSPRAGACSPRYGDPSVWWNVTAGDEANRTSGVGSKKQRSRCDRRCPLLVHVGFVNSKRAQSTKTLVTVRSGEGIVGMPPPLPLHPPGLPVSLWTGATFREREPRNLDDTSRRPSVASAEALALPKTPFENLSLSPCLPVKPISRSLTNERVATENEERESYSSAAAVASSL